MRSKILHESAGRMRVHFYQKHMRIAEADKLEYFLNSLCFVKKATVSERSCNAVIVYDKNCREKLLSELSAFGYERTAVEVPANTGRALNHEYEDRMFWHLALRAASKLFLPGAVRNVLTIVKAVPFVAKGVKTLFTEGLKVEVLDATSIGVSVARKNYETAGSVMFLLKVGDIMDEWTYRKSVDELARVMALNVDKVWMISPNGEEVLVGINKISVGDKVIVRTGNIIPLDGLVVSGEAGVNQASMTGEALPVHKEAGGYVYAGTVVDEGELVIEVKKVSGEGQYDRIISMIEESEKLKSETESRAARIADKLVPYSLGATALTFLLTRNVTKATSILMVDFCCALKLSMPIAVLSAMKEAGEHNISVKGGKFLENVAEATTIIFDKTGTITKANPVVKRVIALDGQEADEMLRLAACLEEHYPHSMANAVVKAAEDKGLTHEEKHAKVEYVVAHGIASSIDGKKVVIGSRHFIFDDECCSIPEGEEHVIAGLSDEYSHLYMAIGGVLSGIIEIEDPLKESAVSSIKGLHELGFDKVVMLTGDNKKTAKRIAEMIGADDYCAEVLPADKAAYIKAEHDAGRKVVMVGDGVNDSPALSEADVGIAINTGAAIAREVADITISDEDLKALLTLRKLSAALMRRIGSNYRFIIGFNSMLILLGVAGLMQPQTSALLHNGSTIAIGLKSMTRLLGDK